jgi:hypothetical protein
MKGRWFRQYESTMDDPKVQMLSDWLYRAWHTLLCFASKCGGEFTDNPEVLSFVLRRSVEVVNDTMKTLVDAHLFDKTKKGYKPHNWDKLQYKSDTSTGRVKQFRKRFRNVSETPNETPPEQIQSRADTETEKKVIPARTRASKTLDVPEGFEDWWAEYPLKKSKIDAIKAFRKAVPSLVQLDHLIACTRSFARAVKGKEPEFIKHPGGWLRGQLWSDHAPASNVVKFQMNEEEQRLQELAEARFYGKATH